MVELDLRGQVCPYPTSAVYGALRTLPPGEALTVVSDYAPARQTIPAIAQQFGCPVDLRESGDGLFTIVIRKPVAAAPA
jgi:tRNA 2-thiouridine synthesizing protein A